MTKDATIKPLVTDIPKAGALFGLSRNASYAAANRGDIPTIRIGKLRKVPLAALERRLEMADQPTNRETGTADTIGNDEPLTLAERLRRSKAEKDDLLLED